MLGSKNCFDSRYLLFAASFILSFSFLHHHSRYHLPFFSYHQLQPHHFLRHTPLHLLHRSHRLHHRRDHLLSERQCIQQRSCLVPAFQPSALRWDLQGFIPQFLLHLPLRRVHHHTRCCLLRLLPDWDHQEPAYLCEEACKKTYFKRRYQLEDHFCIIFKITDWISDQIEAV